MAWLSGSLTGGHATTLLCRLAGITSSLVCSSRGDGEFVPNESVKHLVRQLARCVLHDDLHFPVASLPELILRTRRMIVLGAILQLETLALESEERASRYSSMASSLRQEVSLNTAQWLPWRMIAEGAGFRVMALYHESIRTALSSLSALADTSPLGERLRHELNSTCDAQVASLIEQIVIAIHIRIDMEAARNVWPTVGGQSLISLPPAYFFAMHQRLQSSYA